MKWLIILFLLLLVLGLYFYTPETKEIIGMAIHLLKPAKEAAVGALSP